MNGKKRNPEIEEINKPASLHSISSTIFYLSVVLIFLVGCGRKHSGDIINNRDEVITIKLTLQYPDKDPTIYLIDDAKNQVKSAMKGYNKLGDCNGKYDPENKVITFVLKKGEKLDLGTVRGDNTRDSIEGWEFNQLEVVDSSDDILYGKEQLQGMIDRYFFTISQKTHYIEID